MSDLLWLTDEQMERLRPFFPKSHGKPRVDDRRVLSGIVFVNRNGLRWRAADGHDRRDLPEGAPHGIEPAG
jgi:transposase